MDPHGLKLWLVFLGVWIAFWATAGGIVCHKFKRKGLQGAILGGILAVVGILIVLVNDEPPGE